KSIELKKSLENSLGSTIPATIAFEYPTLETLTQYLAKDIFSLAMPSHTDSHKDRVSNQRVVYSDDYREELEHLSKSEIEALLAYELAAVDELIRGD
ncbi:MAG: acyl carrier protein, partial [Acidobacteriota bacterium]